MRDTQKTTLTIPVGRELAKIARVPASAIDRFINEVGMALERCWRDAADVSTTQMAEGAIANLKRLGKAARAYAAALEALESRARDVFWLFLAGDGTLPAVSGDQAARDAPVALRGLCREVGRASQRPPNRPARRSASAGVAGPAPPGTPANCCSARPSTACSSTPAPSVPPSAVG